MADPLPAVRSFFPDAEARRRLRRQSFEIDRLLHGNHVRHHNVVVALDRSKIVKIYLADFQIFDQRYFVDPVARSIRMNGLKTLSDFTLYRVPILRFDVIPHLPFHLFAVVNR